LDLETSVLRFDVGDVVRDGVELELEAEDFGVCLVELKKSLVDVLQDERDSVVCLKEGVDVGLSNRAKGPRSATSHVEGTRADGRDDTYSLQRAQFISQTLLHLELALPSIRHQVSTSQHAAPVPRLQHLFDVRQNNVFTLVVRVGATALHRRERVVGEEEISGEGRLELGGLEGGSRMRLLDLR
jgi:hypothetical protein